MYTKRENEVRLISDSNFEFIDIVDKYSKNLLFYIDRFIHNLSISEDLVEDAFVQVILRKITFINEIKFKAYLFKTGRNLAFNYLKRSSLIKIVYFENYTDEIMDEKVLLEEIILKDEQKRLLRNSMQKLNPDYREVLHLIYFEDMSYDMAGIVMKKNRKQIENLVCRARKQLKIIVEEDGIL